MGKTLLSWPQGLMGPTHKLRGNCQFVTVALDDLLVKSRQMDPSSGVSHCHVRAWKILSFYNFLISLFEFNFLFWIPIEMETDTMCIVLNPITQLICLTIKDVCSSCGEKFGFQEYLSLVPVLTVVDIDSKQISAYHQPGQYLIHIIIRRAKDYRQYLIHSPWSSTITAIYHVLPSGHWRVYFFLFYFSLWEYQTKCILPSD